MWELITLFFNPLNANVEYTPHDGDGEVTCSGCGASYRQNH